MHQHLHDSMCFLYKQEEVTCEDLLSATRETKMEWTESKISVRVKSASVEKQREEGVTELKKKDRFLDYYSEVLHSCNWQT